MPRGQTPEERFWSRVLVQEGCWLWVGSCCNNGYGQLWWDGRLRKATHVSWILFGGQAPSDKIICHTCDNPQCVNPDHLYVGTPKTNAVDRETRGRGNHATGRRNGSSKYPERVSAGLYKFYQTHTVSLETKAQQSLSQRARHAANPDIQRGERNPHAVLTWAKVRRIRAEYKQGTSQHKLARKYAVGVMTINHVVLGRTWVEDAQ